MFFRSIFSELIVWCLPRAGKPAYDPSHGIAPNFSALFTAEL